MAATVVLMAGLCAAAVALSLPAGAAGRLRAVPAVGSSTPGPVGRDRRRPADLRARAALAASATAGLGLAVLVGGAPGAVVGVVCGTVTFSVLRRLEPRAERDRRERLAADLPAAVDLLGACLAAGRPPTAALSAVAAAVGGPLQQDLGMLVLRLRLGGDPVTLWAEVAARGGPLAALGRTMARSLQTGAPMADGLHLLAEDLRRRRRAVAEQQARGVGVRAAAPLGLCFLPAFVLVGVVPSVVAAFSAMSWW